MNSLLPRFYLLARSNGVRGGLLDLFEQLPYLRV